MKDTVVVTREDGVPFVAPTKGLLIVPRTNRAAGEAEETILGSDIYWAPEEITSISVREKPSEIAALIAAAIAEPGPETAIAERLDRIIELLRNNGITAYRQIERIELMIAEIALVSKNPGVAEKPLDATDIRRHTHRHKTKGYEIAAFQITRGRRVDNSDWPVWLSRAWNLPEKGDGLSPQDYPNSDGTDRLVVREGGEDFLVDWGDYIILLESGSLMMCPHENFESAYEVIDCAHAKPLDTPPPE